MVYVDRTWEDTQSSWGNGFMECKVTIFWPEQVVSNELSEILRMNMLTVSSSNLV
jgi:hypothetical protein